MMTRLPALLLLVGLFAGCDLAEEDFQPEVVVEGVLIAGEPMTSVRLSETAPLGAVYAFERYALSGATVRVLLLTETGEVEETFELVEDLDAPSSEESPFGIYVPEPRPKPRVLPNRRYRLEVEVPEGRTRVPPGALIRAETVVPDTFSIVTQPPASIPYNIFEPSPGIDVTASVNPDRQSVFIFNIRAMEPDDYPLTPLVASFVQQGDLNADNLISGSSPLLNEANYERNADGSLRLRVPWFAINYFGPNVFTANALDDAFYDFLRSRDAQFNPTTLSPGEIQRAYSNVENGVGVFGSIARARTNTVFIEE